MSRNSSMTCSYGNLKLIFKRSQKVTFILQRKGQRHHHVILPYGLWQFSLKYVVLPVTYSLCKMWNYKNVVSFHLYQDNGLKSSFL